MRYSGKSILVIDNGLFVDFASTLSRDFDETFYYVPWESAFPTSNTRRIGEGVRGITRVLNPFEVFDEVDIVVFPDVHFGPMAEWMSKQGKPVWSSKLAEFLELDRARSKELVKKLGIDVGPYEVIKGIDNLIKFLKNNKNQYVKVSTTRGDMETFHSPSFEIVEPALDELEHKLGGKKHITEFIVEEAIDDAVEVGYDGFTIDGQFANTAMFGLEIKNKGFVMESLPYDELPRAVQDINAKLSPVFKEFSYRGFWSSEIRVTKDKAYLIDPCCRAGVPPNELMQVMIANWAEIIWEGAHGNVVEPECTGKFGAELLLCTSMPSKNWQLVHIPDEVRANVKLHNHTVVSEGRGKSRDYVIPQAVETSYIGAAAAVSDTLEDAIDKARYYASKVEGYYLQTYDESLDQALEEYEELKKLE